MAQFLMLVLLLLPSWAGAMTYTCPYEVIHDTGEDTLTRRLVVTQPATLAVLRAAYGLSGDETPWGPPPGVDAQYEVEVGVVNPYAPNRALLSLDLTVLDTETSNTVQNEMASVGCFNVADVPSALVPPRVPTRSGDSLVFDREDVARNVVHPRVFGLPDNPPPPESRRRPWGIAEAWAFQVGPNTPVLCNCNATQSPYTCGGAFTQEIDSDENSFVEAINGTTCRKGVNTGGSAWINTSTFGPSMEGYLTIVANGAAVVIIALRISGAGTASPDYMACRLGVFAGGANDTVEVYRVDNGTLTPVSPAVTQEWANTDRLLCRMHGPTVQVVRCPGGSNCVVLLTHADSTYLAAGHLGVWTNAQGFTYDDFGGGTIRATGGAIGRYLLGR